MWASGKKASGAVGFASRFRAYRSATQSIVNSAFDKVEFNLEQYDDNSEYDHVTNHRWTCKVAGKYHIAACVPLAALAVTKTCWLVAKEGGDTDILCGEERPGFGGQVAPLVVGDYEFAVDEYVEIWIYQNSGGALDTYHNYSDPTFSVHRIA